MRRGFRKWLFGLTVGAAGLAVSHAAVTFDLVFPDVVNATGHYWDDPAYGLTARTEIQTRLNEFGAVFFSNATIRLSVESVVSSSYYARTSSAWSQLQAGGFYDLSSYAKINTGFDSNGVSPEGTMTFNFDFVTLGLGDAEGFIGNIQGLTRHEVLHLLGMSSFLSINLASRYDTFLYDSTGTPLITGTGAINSAANRNDPAMYFLAANGTHYQIASAGDYSHLINVSYPYKYAFDANDLQWLATMGYAVVPEPAPVALLGFAFVLLSAACPGRRLQAR